MKLLSFMLLVFCVHAGARGFSQTITFSGEKISLKQVFGEIEKQSGYLIVCNSQLIKNAPPVTLEVKDMPLETFIGKVLDNLDLGYFIENQTIVIRRKATPRADRMVVLSPTDRIVTGVVRDSAGRPVQGVSVKIKGKTVGTATDQEGRFSLRADTDDILEISNVGFRRQEVRVGESGTLTIYLQAIAVEMEAIAVVATGYQTRKASQMIGSVSSVTAKDLETAGTVTLDKAIAGKMPGVYIRSASGKPGEIGEIRVRGINTMTGDKEPLFVLDGMPLQSGEITGSVSRVMTTGIGNIPPEDIESITILRDATAAAIYGARAANGVVVITTKTGTAGKDYVTYTGKVGVTEAPVNRFNFMNSAEKIAFERQLYNDYHPVYGGRVIQLLNQADNGVISKEEAETQITALEGVNTNWIKELYHRALSHSHNLSLSGGSAKTQYYASLNFQNSEGTMVNNKYTTGGLNLKLSHYVRKNLLVRLNLYSTLKNNTYTQSLLDPFKYAVFANTYEKPYNDDGSYAYDMSYRDLTNDITYNSALNYTTLNILREIKENTLRSMYGNLRGQLNLEYSFLRNFRFISSASLDYTTVHGVDESYAGTYRSYYSSWVKGGYGGPLLEDFNRGFLKEDMVRTLNYTVRNSLEFNKTFASKHFVQAFAAQDVSGSRTYGFNHFNPIYEPDYRLAGYPTWGDINPNTSGDIPYSKYNLLNLSKFGGTSFAENRSVSFISSLVYSYDNRYVFNGNWRMDGVDIIGSKNQFSPLWSAGIKWNAHNEAFLKPLQHVINRLVPFVGYGYRGSINRSVYPFHVYTLGIRNYDGMVAANEIAYGNPVLKWEKKRELNLGLELSLFNGRVNFEGQYYKEKVIDLLDQTPLPASIGRRSTTVNVGSLSNKGVDLSTRLEAVRTRDLLLEFSGNISLVTNRLDNVYNKLTPNIAKNVPFNAQGNPVNSWYGYKYDHINQENGHMMVWAVKEDNVLKDGKVTTTFTDELIDINAISDAVLQASYRTYYLGHLDPDVFGGFSARVAYKSLELFSQFTYAGGNQLLSFQDRLSGPSVINDNPVDDITASRTNRLKETAYRWRQPGDITDIPRFSNLASNYGKYLIDRDLSSGAYLKCTQLALSWRSSGTRLKSTVLDNVRATLMVNNLFQASPYIGTDPETQTAFGYPNTRNYMVSISLGF